MRALALHDAEPLTDVPSLGGEGVDLTVAAAAPTDSTSPEAAPPAVASIEHPSTSRTPPVERPAQPAEQIAPAPSVLAEAPPSPPVAPAGAMASVSRPAPAAATAPDALAPAPMPSPFGVGRLVVRVDGSRVRTTEHSVESISGQVLGGRAHRVLLYLNGTPRDLVLDGERFDVPLELQPGLNDVRVVARASDGAETEDRVTVQYNAAAIRLTSPREGEIIAAGDPPFVVVEGEVRDTTATAAWVLVNDLRVLAAVRQGRFRRAVPMLEAVARVRAQTQGDDAVSETVTVRTAAVTTPAAVIVVDRSNEPGSDADVSGTWRSRAERVDVPIHPVALRRFSGPRQEPESEIIYVPHMKPGVYRFALRSPASGNETTRATIYLRLPDGVSRHLLRPSGDGRSTVLQTRMLLPHGVTWDQDDWFTGRSEGPETITKFRLPEGVTWTERRGGAR